MFLKNLWFSPPFSAPGHFIIHNAGRSEYDLQPGKLELVGVWGKLPVTTDYSKLNWSFYSVYSLNI